jgi:hypothetical protein
LKASIDILVSGYILTSVKPNAKRRLAELAVTIAQGAPTFAAGGGATQRVPVINPRDLTSTLPVQALLESASVQTTPRTERARVRAGDVLVAARGTQFRASLVPEETSGAVASANLLVVRLGPELLPEVLVAFLRSSQGERQLLATSNGTTTGAFLVTARSLGALEVDVPPMHVQRTLAAFTRASAVALEAAEHLLELRREFLNGVVEAVLAGDDIGALARTDVL